MRACGGVSGLGGRSSGARCLGRDDFPIQHLGHEEAAAAGPVAEFRGSGCSSGAQLLLMLLGRLGRGGSAGLHRRGCMVLGVGVGPMRRYRRRWC